MEAVIDRAEEVRNDELEFPEWLTCPYCGDEGTKQNLRNYGHYCCRQFLLEIDEGDDDEKYIC
jgi:hypothetical protein